MGIKLRVWNPNLSQMVYEPNKPNFKSGTNVTLENGELYAEYQDETKMWIMTEIMFATELKDRNGVEVYYGDAVMISYGGNDSHIKSICNESDLVEVYNEINDCGASIEIEGNIHQQPRLK